MQLAYQIFTSPLGELLVAGTPRAITHIIRGENRSRICSDFLMANENVARFGKTRYVQEACEIIADYFSGKCDVTNLNIEVMGTELERKVWDALRDIPYGETLTYSELAEIVGAKGALDEVISACARNPVPLLIPSHRALRHAGDADNFVWGRDAKRFLMHMEAGNALPLMNNPEALYTGTRIYG